MFSIFDWSQISLFFSANTTQDYLKKCYQRINLDYARQKSYENCYPFIYYLEHGKEYYKQASSSPLIIQPILIFYGFIHLIKACILTVDPAYPESTTVLAHGVSTRKRKKQQYLFFQDEIKIQKNGLFSHMSENLFQIKQEVGRKITMSELFKQIPELNDLFLHLDGKPTFSPVKLFGNKLCIPEKVLETYHMTEKRFADFFFSKSSFKGFLQKSDTTSLILQLDQKNKYSYTPLKYDLRKKNYAFPLNNNDLLEYSELLIHYLLLYNLSMIARYETEWWSELVKTMPNKDYPFIESFLKISINKGPFLIYQYLISQKVK